MGQVKQFPTSEDYYIRQLQIITNKAIAGLTGNEVEDEKAIDWSFLKGLSKTEKLTLLNKVSGVLTNVIVSFGEMNDTIEKVKSRL